MAYGQNACSSHPLTLPTLFCFVPAFSDTHLFYSRISIIPKGARQTMTVKTFNINCIQLFIDWFLSFTCLMVSDYTQHMSWNMCTYIYTTVVTKVDDVHTKKKVKGIPFSFEWAMLARHYFRCQKNTKCQEKHYVFAS